MTKNNIMEKIVSLCKRRGFVWQDSEIYGGISAIWDFGPLGVEMKNAIKKIWWDTFVRMRPDIVGIEGSILMHPTVWKASGHLESFTDPLVECKECHNRYREDHLKEGKYKDQGKAKEVMQCPSCGSKVFTEPKSFNLLFEALEGTVEGKKNTIYLRGETAQSMFCDFKLVADSMRMKLPFGIAQIGKSFRNEITTGDFFFRSREFEIAELEYFVKPGDDEKWFDEWLELWQLFYADLGINPEKLSEYEHPKKSLAHYSKRTVDIMYEFPFGVSELAGVANRTDYDLSQHEKFSGKDLHYFDEAEGKKIVPYVIEPTMGVDRIILACLVDGYQESDGTDGREKGEIVLKLHPKIAPIQVAVFPLMKKEKMPDIANDIRYNATLCGFRAGYDESGSIGKRYRRQDEIGTPFCVTVDYQTLEDQTVTIRERDSMKQERIKISEVNNYLFEKINC
ncbi:glycine--tRNA ligase [Candidatus Berkelbacteria bacterium CG08_land_8_20_14_0_20_39_8]|uniref:Glycine--tRNA ligase n=1 Tax=Candidatus Berkelbacteria bacterium CG08_land_8_20_14_0_20_39_8 TaxID=1974511 RepID=A0A2M6YCR3_9BACT|nr:MAG: glycine--tRNA ligase [Candidatus Berkelbacteria bacterium CG08_land_8_20_14_0_20_39_8]